VRDALASAGYTRPIEAVYETIGTTPLVEDDGSQQVATADETETTRPAESSISDITREIVPPTRQGSIEFGFAQPADDEPFPEALKQPLTSKGNTARDLDAILRHTQSESPEAATDVERTGTVVPFRQSGVENSVPVVNEAQQTPQATHSKSALPPLASASNLVREVPLEAISANIRPLGQLEESYIIATDDEGLLLIDQHVAHERILFDKYRRLESSRSAESQNLLMPETFDLTPAQAATFDSVAEELETYGFGLMRLSGRTVAIRAVPADLPAGEARNMLAEVLETVDSEKRGAARATLRDEIAARLACRAAIKINTPLALEKMRWLIDRLLLTSSPTTCPHGRPVILRLTTRDIEKGFHRS